MDKQWHMMIVSLNCCGLLFRHNSYIVVCSLEYYVSSGLILFAFVANGSSRVVKNVQLPSQSGEFVVAFCLSLLINIFFASI